MATDNDELTHLSAHDLTFLIDTHHRRHTRSKAQFIRAIGEFHARNLSRLYCAPSTATWLVRTYHIAESTAYEQVRIATFLRGHPILARAFYAAQVTYSIVRYLMSYIGADTSEEDEEAIVAAAVTLTPAELKDALAGVAPKDSPKKESVSVSKEPDGWVRLSARLRPTHAAELLSALKIGELSGYTDPPADDEEIDAALAAHEPVTPVASRFGPPPGTKLLGSFLNMLSIVRSARSSAVRAPGAEVVYVADADGRLRTQNDLAAGPADALLQTVINSKVRTLLMDRHGNPTSLSSPSRFATDSQIKALLTLTGGQCAAPGCTHRRWLQAHHIVDHSAGGPTDTLNLIMLCSACHSMVSDGLMTIWVDPQDPDITYFAVGDALYTSHHRSAPVLTEHLLGRNGVSVA
ncbi:HNH endonuclease signature motif containing protein [Corynebacterium uterequi]|uniref:HNH endonuclease n=1 Tax=Corynebacterium uterequi TaxID=1072256 RepID=A0A0G3HDQ7_9CORY|nr:HNH endonuclease signature motif containing protein [Corynebacterium uterequi]AKK10103.1 HNH endonuclease [Corynebacterium uterequi]